MRKINAITSDAVLAALRQGAGTSRKLGADRRVLCDPVGKGVFAVLNDAKKMLESVVARRRINVRLASFISIIRVSCLTRSHWSIINELKQVLSISGDNGELLAMLAQSIKLVCKGSLEFLAGNVGQLGFSDERLGFSANKLLLENNNLGRVWFLVFQLSNVIGDLLFS